MSLAEQIQKFLKEKFDQQKLKRKHFIQNTGLPASTVSKMFNAEHRNPEFKAIIKIADYFDCTIDEVLDRKKYLIFKEIIFFHLSSKEINLNVKNFLERKINELELNKYKLGKNLGFNEHIIADFIKDNNRQKILGSAVIVAIADYFKVSIDEMIGRASSSNQEPQQTVEAIKEPSS